MIVEGGWQEQILDNVIRMLRAMPEEDRTASLARIVNGCKPEDVPSDLVPIHGSFRDRVSTVRRDFTRGGEVVRSAREQAERDATHPHERKDPEMNPRPRRRLPLGEKFDG